MRKKYAISFILFTAALLAAIPAGYYDSADGLNGNDLRLALHNIIDGHTQKTYDYVWTAFASTDVRPVETYGPEKIWCMYTHLDFDYNEDQQGNISSDVYTTYNREHSWPKSWANETYPMYSDIFHLYPTQAYANTYRNNNPYGEVGSSVTYTTENGSKLGQARAGLGFAGTVFEPIDEYKGDLARTYFYMSTRYYTEDAAWDTSEMTNKCEIKDWAMSMLLNWHHNDPVSQKELDRIEAVYAIQGNRNPFIDHPEYADSIWNLASPTFAAPTAQTASSVFSNGFTANWSAVSEASGYKLYVSTSSDFSSPVNGYNPKDVGNVQHDAVSGLMTSTTYYYRVVAYKTGEESAYSNIITVTTSAPVGSADSTKIFFSEYIEGSSNNKALEIYNGSGTDIDLSKITMKLYSNSAVTPSATVTLNGTLGNEAVYVVANASSASAILAVADMYNNSVINFNGNDAIELYYHNALIDIIGVVSTSTADFAKDVTLVRKPEILHGNTTYTVSEWNSYSVDEFSYLGSHTVDSDTPLAISLRTLSATCIDDAIVLSWSTASETENALFQIFRNNEFLTSIPGGGTTSVTNYYEYIDRDVFPGNTYTYILTDVAYNGDVCLHDEQELTISIPGKKKNIRTGSVYPNPGNPAMTLPLEVQEAADVSVLLYDIRGRKMRDVLSGYYTGGTYDLTLDLSGIPSGVYILQVRSDKVISKQKVLLMK